MAIEELDPSQAKEEKVEGEKTIMTQEEIEAEAERLLRETKAVARLELNAITMALPGGEEIIRREEVERLINPYGY